jgi:hypothetical protein
MFPLVMNHSYGLEESWFKSFFQFLKVQRQEESPELEDFLGKLQIKTDLL